MDLLGINLPSLQQAFTGYQVPGTILGARHTMINFIEPRLQVVSLT